MNRINPCLRQLGRSVWLWLGIVTVSSSLASQSHAEEWLPYMIAPPEVREQLREIPIRHRPYRPGHFVGNTVRRVYDWRTDGSRRNAEQRAPLRNLLSANR